MTIQTTARNASLGDLAALLQTQQARKVDLAASASKIHADGGLIVVTGADAELTEDGVTAVDGTYRPTAVFDEGVAEKLGIPQGYLKRLRAERPDLYDANINGWLHGDGADVGSDSRTFFLRTFKPDNGEDGIARAFLSDRFGGMTDNLDALTAALEGVHLAGVQAEMTGCDLTERRMTVRVEAPEITALAPALLRDYRSPFTGESGNDLPIMWAGLVISNSETGNGAFTITPRFTVQICRNGMTVTKDALRAVHLGGKREEGIVRYSEATQVKELELIRAKTTDAVRTFLDADYMADVIARWEAEAGREVETVDAVRDLTKGLQFTEDHINGVLGMFIKGGQMTVGGVVNAITAYTQTVEDPDDANQMEVKAMTLLHA